MKNYLGEAGMNEEELKYFISKAEVPNKDLRRRIIEKGTEINSTHFIDATCIAKLYIHFFCQCHKWYSLNI